MLNTGHMHHLVPTRVALIYAGEPLNILELDHLKLPVNLLFEYFESISSHRFSQPVAKIEKPVETTNDFVV